MFSVLSRLLSQLALWTSAAGLVAMTAIIGWQVFARYVLNAPPSWTEQFALLLMLYFILFAAAAGVREGFHIRLSLLQDTAPAGIRRLMLLIVHALVAIFGGFMLAGGVELIAATWQHTIPSLGWPRGVAYIPLAGAGGLIVFFALEKLIAEWRGKSVEALWN